MASHCNDLHAGKSGLFYHFRKKFSDNGTRFYQFSEDIGAQAAALDQIIVPVPFLCIQKLSGAGKGIFIIHLSSQEIAEKLRHKQQARCFFVNVRAHLFIRIQLK